MDDVIISHQENTTAICIGHASGDLPHHLMTGEKTCGYIVRNNQVETWYWDAIRERDGKRWIDGPSLPILPFSEISKSLRATALQRITELALAFQKVPANFIRPSQGMVETWRIYFFEDEGVLLLPSELSQIMLYFVTEEMKFTHVNRYMKPNIEPPFGLCHQFTQFLYVAATGIAPYQSSDVREDRFRHIPLSIFDTDLDPRLTTWIDFVLSMDSKKQREVVSAAYSAEDNLAWFLEAISQFSWSIKDPIVPVEIQRTQVEAVREFQEQQRKRADLRRFLRKRGALLASITVGVILVVSTVTSMIYQALQPPYTAGMPAVEVIQEFFTSQNELDITKMGASLARGTKNPYEMEVSGLFVNTKVRQAYEGFNAVIRADQWIAQGKPPIAPSSVIYGVDTVRIEQIQDNRYRATYHIYYPSEQMKDQQLPVVLADIVEKTTEFELTDKKGYYQITEIIPITSHVVETVRIETTEENPKPLGQ